MAPRTILVPSPTYKPEANHLFVCPSAWHAPVDFEPPVFLQLLIVASQLLQTALSLMLASSFFAAKLFASVTFGTIIGSILGIYCPNIPSYIWHIFTTFGSSDYSVIAPILWLLVLVVASLPTSTLHQFLRVPPDPEPPKGTKYYHQLSRNKQKRFHRLLFHQHRARTRSRPCRHIHHHALATKQCRPMHDGDAELVSELVERIVGFANSIRFRRVRREGDERRSKQSKKSKVWNRKPKPKIRKKVRTEDQDQKYRYRPTKGHGIPYKHLNIINSPAAHVYFTTIDIPSHLITIAKRFRGAFHLQGKERQYAVIWDSDASISISSHREDFVGPIESPPPGLKVVGIAKGLTIRGIGYVAWSFKDDQGMLRTLKVPAYYVPEASARLLSIPSLLQTYKDKKVEIFKHGLWMTGNKMSGRNGIYIPVDPASNLHVATAFDYDGSQRNTDSSNPSDTSSSSTGAPPTSQANNYRTDFATTSEANHNLSSAAKELIGWHDRMGHLDYRKVQFVLRTGVLAHSESARRIQAAASKLTHHPMYASCQFGKQRRKPAPGKKSNVVCDREGALKKDDLFCRPKGVS